MDSPRLTASDRSDILRVDINQPDSDTDLPIPRLRRSASPAPPGLFLQVAPESPHLTPHTASSSSFSLNNDDADTIAENHKNRSHTHSNNFSENYTKQQISEESQIDNLYNKEIHGNKFRDHIHEHVHKHDHSRNEPPPHHSHHHHHSHDGHIYNKSKPLPSISHIFSTLPPLQKTLFTWASIHFILGVVLWLKGQWDDRLALTGYGYLVIFDALGVFTNFVSNTLVAYRSLREPSIKHPFGVQRYEVLFGFVSVIYLLFVSIYTLKESLEHIMLETTEEEHYDMDSSEFPLFLALSSIGVTLVSAIRYRNHTRFSTLLRTSSTLIPPYSTHYSQGISSVFKNHFTLASLVCGTSVVVVGLIVENNPVLGWVDVLVSLIESVVMFYLARPIVMALGKILLQTTPDAVIPGLEACLRGIERDPAILELTSTHFFQNSYGQLVGTLSVHVKANTDEQAVLAEIYQQLGPLLGVGNTSPGIPGGGGGGGELTVQIIK